MKKQLWFSGSGSLVLVVGLTVFAGGCNGGSGSQEGLWGSQPSVFDHWKAQKPLPGGGGSKAESYEPLGLKAKVFEISNRKYAPMNFQSQDLVMTFDPAEKTFAGRSRIQFRQTETARPVFLLAGDVTSAKLNGIPVTITRVHDPENLNTFQAIDFELQKDESAVVEIDYTIPADRYSFQNGGVGFLTNMTDLSEKFFERWGPANLEEDTFKLKLTLKVVGATSASHRLFANGVSRSLAAGEWTIDFPDHFVSSSFFVHLTNRELDVRTFTYQGLERAIPVTVYSSDPKLVAEAVSLLPGLFAELEGDYGPYAHPSFIALMNPGGGGMEYVGATITSVSALDHELFHSWFARGVMPADGRSGWIDEAMASWRDYGYYRAGSLLGRARTNLAGYSPFWRATPSNSYRDGRALLAEFDLLLAGSGGFKPVMKDWFANYKLGRVTTEEFWAYLERRTNLDFTDYFKRYVFGGKAPHVPIVAIPEEPEANPVTEEHSVLLAPEIMKHPAPLTEEELLKIR